MYLTRCDSFEAYREELVNCNRATASLPFLLRLSCYIYRIANRPFAIFNNKLAQITLTTIDSKELQEITKAKQMSHRQPGF